MKYALVDAEKANYPIAKVCKWVGVSRSGYYAWEGRPESLHAVEDLRGAVEGFYSEQPAGRAVASPAPMARPAPMRSRYRSRAAAPRRIPEFGAGEWQKLSLDQTALDHADPLCQNLETRPW